MDSPLFQPLVAGALHLPNRILMAPMTRTRAGRTHVPGELMATHYAQRAGAGLLIAEATMVDPDASAFLGEPGLTDDAQEAGWRRVATAVHAAGGRIAVQLWHPGRSTHPDINGGAPAVSSSARPIRHGEVRTWEGKKPYPVPRALETAEVPRYVELFRAAAERAKRAGLDAVELHAAHGYLIDQFLRDGVNDRTDRYGGSLEARARFLFEVFNAVAGVMGPERTGVRISPRVAYGDMVDSDPEALTEVVATGLQERRAAFLHVRHSDPRDVGERAVAAVARRCFGGALVLNGDFDRDAGAAAIAAGEADAIAYGRPFIANPDLVRRFALGAPLNAVDPVTTYGTGAEGYIDYPALAA